MSQGDGPRQLFLLRRRLQIEFLRQELPDCDRTEELLGQIQRNREQLDAVVFALASRELALDRRQHLLEMLRQHQRALDQCLEQLGVASRVQGRAPLWHFYQLDPVARSHLAAILGVPEEPPFYEVLDAKAEEYLAQRAAFETFADRLGFEERQEMPLGVRRAALVLTLSGSLIQLSEPTSSRGLRRYLYQNIYGNAHPPEGSLVLERDIHVGHRLRSMEITTSPVRLLRLIGRKMSWKVHSQNFERIANTLSSLVLRGGSACADGQSVDRPPAGPAGAGEAAPRIRDLLQAGQGQTFVRLETLRRRFLELEELEGRRVEAELLTLCHYLQAAARQLGAEARQLADVIEFTTESGQRYRRGSGEPLITMLPPGGNPEVVFAEATVGRQLVTCHAPIALIGKSGGVVEVTRPVSSIVSR